MNSNQLKYFVAAAESHSFTKAADRYNISQTAVTQQIQILEEQLGCTLFNRSTRPITLTPSGHTFLLEAKDILERMELAANHVRESANGLSGNLKISYVSGYERSSISNFMAEFHRKNPNIFLGFYRNSANAMDSGILNNEYDIIFTWDKTSLRQNDETDSIYIEKSRLVAVLYKDHPLSHKKEVSRADLRDEKFIYTSHSGTYDPYVEAYFMELYKKSGFKPDIIFRSSEIESTLMMIAAEEGISILPEYCAHRLNPDDNIVFVPLTGDDESDGIIALWRKNDSNPALKLLVDDLKSKLS